MRMLPAALRALSRVLLPIAICGAVGAQDLVPVPDPSIAESLKCLTGNEGKSVKYPEYERTTGRGGTVRVRLEFFSPVKGPLASVLSAPSQALGDAVRWYVDDYRMPCLKKGKPPVVAIQEFSFDPRDGQRVTFAGLRRSAEASPWDKACKVVGVEHTRLTTYPPKAARENGEGTVLALARFDGPDIAPVVTILNPGGHRALEAAVAGSMEQLRIECTEPVDYWPRTFQQTYTFLLEGKARPLLPPGPIRFSKNLSLFIFLSCRFTKCYWGSLPPWRQIHLQDHLQYSIRCFQDRDIHNRRNRQEDRPYLLHNYLKYLLVYCYFFYERSL